MQVLPVESAPRYRPRAPSNPLKEIVEDSLEDLLRSWEERFAKDHGALHPRVRDLLDAFVLCGDAHFGFLRLRCPDCGHEKILPFSCKARGVCPSCSKKRAIAWAERLVEEVLPHVPYVQLVFTIPKILRKAFLFDRSLFGDLSRAAYQATLDFLREHFPALERAVPAMVVSPQSFGSLLNHHPHAHAVCSLGLFDPQGTFHPLAEDTDFSRLEEIFRERLFNRVTKALWLVLYVFVAVQMAWVLRPFIGSRDLPPQFFREDAWSNAYVQLVHVVGRALRLE